MADAFMREAHQFQLGDLPTEQPHPLTEHLAELARHDLPAAIACLRAVDLDALDRLRPAAAPLEALRTAVADTLHAGGRVFLCGCGATGRLSISLEVLWRELHAGADAERVVSFMAGGDLALVRSVENFEDHPEYGAHQLEELGFADGDLLISTTEGGETPFVIGATERAAALSMRSPWFLYCNPDDVLRARVERSRRVIDDPAIRKINLYVGPMALTGSTRMQASTVLMLGVGEALLHDHPIAESLERFREAVGAAPLQDLAPLVERESAVYAAGGYTLYETDRYAITILTDTTERSPTFSLRAFENFNDAAPMPSLASFHLPGTASAADAWHRLLHRPPHALEWEGVAEVAGRHRLLGFDFSDVGRDARVRLLDGSPQTVLRVDREGGTIRLDGLRLPVEGSGLLHEHLLLKVALNIHSTLVMGRLGRYERNLMTWVRPSNKKLIDRSIRYVQHLLRGAGIDHYAYEDVARATFAEMAVLTEDEPIVLRVFERLARP